MARVARSAYNGGVNRTLRIVLAAGVLALLVVGGALAAPSERGQERMAPVAASHQPQSPEAQAHHEDEDPDAPPSEQLLDRLVGTLNDAGIETDAETIAELAADHGVGGAVRLLAWADASGMSTGELADMFASGMGWGEIAQELDLHPGIGTIMGNGGGNGPPDHAQGLGRAGAPGQQDR
jgi:hypothetical protein